MILWGLSNNILTVVDENTSYLPLEEEFVLGEYSIVGIVSTEKVCEHYAQYFESIQHIKQSSREAQLNHSIPWVQRKYDHPVYWIARRNDIYYSGNITSACRKTVCESAIVGHLSVADIEWRSGTTAIDVTITLVNQLHSDLDYSNHTDVRLVLYTLSTLFLPKSTLTEYSLSKGKSVTKTRDKYPKRIKEKAKELITALF